MKYRQCFFIILLLLSLIIGEVKALTINTGFDTESLPESDIDTLLKNVNISMLEDEPPKNTIECFDVNEDGIIAIGCSNFDSKTVCIYTNDGNFQYGYSFKCNGKFGIELNNDILIIYFVRSDIAIAVNSTGEVESVLKIQNTSDNNYYWNNSVFLTRQKIGDTEYMLKNNMGILNIFASSYSQLIAKPANSEEIVIYDANAIHFSTMVAAFIGVLLFVCLVITIVVFQFIKSKRII